MQQSIAVIIPTHNRRERLVKALDSVLAQTLPPDEICVVDDGSTDGTGELIASRYPRINYLYQEQQGVSVARNAGVAATSSRWIAFLDSDDAWLPRKLARQMAAWQSAPDYPLVHCDEIWIRHGVRVNPMRKHSKAGGDIFFRCLPRCAISPSAVLITRGLFTETGGFDPELPACEDYDLWLRICSRYPVLYVDEPLVRKTGGHEDQLSRRYWGMDRFRVRALDKLLETGQLNPEQSAATRGMLREKCWILLAGANKHRNDELKAWVLAVLEKYQLTLYDDVG